MNMWAIIAVLVSMATTTAAKQVAVRETIFDSSIADIQWISKLAVLVQTSKGKLYRSSDRGESWTHITDELKDPTAAVSKFWTPGLAVDHLAKSPADDKTVLAVATTGTHFISTNAGISWSPFQTKQGNVSIHTFLFHPTEPKWALVSFWSAACEAPVERGVRRSAESCSHSLYLTKDIGKTFRKVIGYVVQFSWGDATLGHDKRIYFTHLRNKRGDQPRLAALSKGVDFAYAVSTRYGNGDSTTLLKDAKKFLISKGFIYVAKLRDLDTHSIALMVSKNGGADFKPVVLPTELEERSYTMLDTADGSAVLHINHDSKYDGQGRSFGNIYVSNKDGSKFTLSLKNNIRASDGQCEFDGVASLKGVYIANIKGVPRSKISSVEEAEQLERSASDSTAVDKRRSSRAKGKDESVDRTVISFNKGGGWSFLTPPKFDSRGKKYICDPKNCYLHLHGAQTFNTYAPSRSHENAVGIIMATGNVGPHLRYETDQVNTFLSRDGGLTWQEAHKGAFIYEFGDHGGLVLMADNLRKTKQVVFSWDEGKSWYDFPLTSLPLDVDNIITEPNATSTRFLAYGTRDGTGVMYHINLKPLGQPLCKGALSPDTKASDYETWAPSDGQTSGCLQGKQVAFVRRKQTSQCFNGEKFERPTTQKTCECTKADYVCALGFTRDIGSRECTLSDQSLLSAPDSCKTAATYQVDAYLKVVGDSCKHGFAPIPVSVDCPAGMKKPSRGIMSLLSTIGVIVGFVTAVVSLPRSERVRAYFANNGFDSFSKVKYAAIAGGAPESAVDYEGFSDVVFNHNPECSVSSRSGVTRSCGDRQRRGGGATAGPVPRLVAPPGSKSGRTPSMFVEDCDLDLL